MRNAYAYWQAVPAGSVTSSACAPCVHWSFSLPPSSSTVFTGTGARPGAVHVSPVVRQVVSAVQAQPEVQPSTRSALVSSPSASRFGPIFTAVLSLNRESYIEKPS